MRKISYLLIFLFLISQGCAPIISKEMRKSISDELIFKDLETYKGKVLLLSGIILGSKNTKEGTLIEILQKPADMGQKLSKDKEKFMGLLFIGCFLKGKPYEAAMKRHMK